MTAPPAQQGTRRKGGGPLAALLDFFLPRKCPFCGAVVNADLPCSRCQRELPWLIGQEAEGRAEFVSRYASALRYQGEVRSAILAFKFARRLGYARVFGLLVAQCAQDHFSGAFDLITWVPLSKERLRERGFDQSRLLAQSVSQSSGVPCRSLLRKRPGVQRQSGLSDFSARRANVLGAYSLPDPDPAEGKRVLLVDDVITSGATLSECARLLRSAGAAQVLGVSLARGGLSKV